MALQEITPEHIDEATIAFVRTGVLPTPVADVTRAVLEAELAQIVRPLVEARLQVAAWRLRRDLWSAIGAAERENMAGVVYQLDPNATDRFRETEASMEEAYSRLTDQENDERIRAAVLVIQELGKRDDWPLSR